MSAIAEHLHKAPLDDLPAVGPSLLPPKSVPKDGCWVRVSFVSVVRMTLLSGGLACSGCRKLAFDAWISDAGAIC